VAATIVAIVFVPLFFRLLTRTGARHDVHDNIVTGAKPADL
jgi:hypothetical protein